MSIADFAGGRSDLPVIGAPVFLVPLPLLVNVTRRAGDIAAFPHRGADAPELLDGWLCGLRATLDAHDRDSAQFPLAPYPIPRLRPLRPGDDS